jgi:hypothetical protein
MEQIEKQRKIALNLLVLYHLISAAIVYSEYKADDFNAGPCNLGLGVVIYLLVGIVDIILSTLSIRSVIKSAANKYFLIINLSVLIIWLFFLFRF